MEKISDKATRICEQFAGFTDGVRVMFLMHRKKDGGLGNKNHHAIRKIITTSERSFYEALCEMLAIKERDGLPYRIQAAVNKRDIDKAIRNFKIDQLNADYADETNRNNFYFDVKNRFISNLMIPQSRAETKFMFDVDDTDALGTYHNLTCRLYNMGVKIFLDYRTPNGFHVITEPFNPQLLGVLPNCELKKDALLLLNY